MTDLDKLNDKEQDKQDTANVNQDTLNEVSGGVVSEPYGVKCPKCHNYTYNQRRGSCTVCGYKG